MRRIIMFKIIHAIHDFDQVKADVHSVSGELIVSGLDSATSLIQVSYDW